MIDYEIVASVIDSAKRIVAGKAADEDEMDIREWGAEVIVTLDKALGDMEGHLRGLVELLGEQPSLPDGPVFPLWEKCKDYLKSLEE